MKVSRREFVDTLLLEPFAAPLGYIEGGDNLQPNKPAGWARYSANAVATAGTRVIVPFKAARFAVQDAQRREKGPIAQARAGVVGFVTGTVISTLGVACNTVQALGGACMTGVSAGVSSFEHGLRSIDAMRTSGGAS